MDQVLESVRTGDWATSDTALAITEMHSAEEVLELRMKISTLAMQKRYWWQRCTEFRDALHIAEGEVTRLREALARAEQGGS